MGGLSSGAVFKEYDVAVHGLTTEYRTDENDRFRFGVYKAKTAYQGNPAYGNFSLQPSSNPFIPFPYYQPSSIYPTNTIIAFTLGADIGLGDGYRLTSEYAMRKIEETDTGPDAQSAYISVSKNMGKWTPYVSLAGMQTSSDIKTLYNALNTDLFRANRQYADTMVAMEQKSVSLGFSYALSPTQKIKAQWTNAHIGSVSNFLIDTPGDQAITHENINVFSLSYSMTF